MPFVGALRQREAAACGLQAGSEASYTGAMRRVKVFQFETYDPEGQRWMRSPLFATWEWICASRAMAIEDSGRYVDARDIVNGICVEAGPPALHLPDPALAPATRQ